MVYFQGMAPDAVDRLSVNSHAISLRRGDVLVAHGTGQERNVYAVLEGQIHLGVPTVLAVRSIRFVDPGMTLGESVLLMGMSSPYQAIATRKSKVLVIDGERWLDEVQCRAETIWEVLRHIA
jgi:CRP-like cAMP-binding protein